MEYVYHVVTEKPMHLGQKIIFDDKHHNGVYNRVTLCRRILDGEKVDSELTELIESDLEKWAKVTYRELALEKVRCEEYLDMPSRLACLYTSRTFDEAKKWAGFFHKIGREVYSIVKLRVDGKIFDGDACNCFDGTAIEAENIEKARHYWKMDVPNENPIIETLVSGIIYVDKIMVDLSIQS